MDTPSLLTDLVRYGTLATSSHNTQCWRFRVDENANTIRPDLSRRCPVVDNRKYSAHAFHLGQLFFVLRSSFFPSSHYPARERKLKIPGFLKNPEIFFQTVSPCL